MSTVTVRDLRNRSADMLARVAQGEHVTVTKDGTPVAQVIPLPRKPLNAATALSRGVPLYTLNPSDFDGIPGLEVCTPRRLAGDPNDPNSRF
ncbi:MAG: type II toxin-antitoxin system prevent-host-death family antitoxin [Leucobacter sp.]